MIPTKTYPLSAIIGDEVDDYERGYAQGCEEGRERITELADAFNAACDENADFVAQSNKDEARIAELQDSFEDAVTRAEQAENRIAELEAQNKTLRNAQKACEFCDEPRVSRIAELEVQFAAVTTERDGLRSALPKRREWNQAGGREDYLYTEGWNDAIEAIDAALQPERRIEEGK